MNTYQHNRIMNKQFSVNTVLLHIADNPCYASCDEYYIKDYGQNYLMFVNKEPAILTAKEIIPIMSAISKSWRITKYLPWNRIQFNDSTFEDYANHVISKLWQYHQDDLARLCETQLYREFDGCFQPSEPDKYIDINYFDEAQELLQTIAIS